MSHKWLSCLTTIDLIKAPSNDKNQLLTVFAYKYFLYFKQLLNIYLDFMRSQNCGNSCEIARFFFDEMQNKRRNMPSMKCKINKHWGWSKYRRSFGISREHLSVWVCIVCICENKQKQWPILVGRLTSTDTEKQFILLNQLCDCVSNICKNLLDFYVIVARAWATERSLVSHLWIFDNDGFVVHLFKNAIT